MVLGSVPSHDHRELGGWPGRVPFRHVAAEPPLRLPLVPSLASLAAGALERACRLGFGRRYLPRLLIYDRMLRRGFERTPIPIQQSRSVARPGFEPAEDVWASDQTVCLTAPN
jgi:hypothetical protein